ncbi:MAG: hypothetical protein R3B70_29515, partial [Polyangiaceae bacterium]
VAKHWGSIPFRQDGEVVKERWSATTKKFDQGNPVLGYKKILGFVSNSLADKVKQVRLDPEIVVDGATYQSVTGAADPGPPDTWSEDTKRAVEKLQVELRRAHKVFLGAFDFFVRESTLEGGAKAFTKDTMTEVFRKPVSPINSGNLCNPDGTAWSGHQDHFHVQIGVTRWAAEAASTEPQDPAQIDANARKLLYDRSAAMVLKLLDKAWAQVEKDAATARDAFERQKKWGKRPADAVWEDQPEAKTQARKLAIAKAYTDEGIKRRIETFDADELPEIIAGDLIDFHTQRGRVLRRWYSRVKGASWGKPSRIGELAADGSLTDAAARERLVAEINAALTTWRDEVVAGK